MATLVALACSVRGCDSGPASAPQWVGCGQDPNLHPAHSTSLLPCLDEQPEGSCGSQEACSQFLGLAGPKLQLRHTPSVAPGWDVAMLSISVSLPRKQG